MVTDAACCHGDCAACSARCCCILRPALLQRAPPAAAACSAQRCCSMLRSLLLMMMMVMRAAHAPAVAAGPHLALVRLQRHARAKTNLLVRDVCWLGQLLHLVEHERAVVVRCERPAAAAEAGRCCSASLLLQQPRLQQALGAAQHCGVLAVLGEYRAGGAAAERGVAAEGDVGSGVLPAAVAAGLLLACCCQVHGRLAGGEVMRQEERLRTSSEGLVPIDSWMWRPLQTHTAMPDGSTHAADLKLHPSTSGNTVVASCALLLPACAAAGARPLGQRDSKPAKQQQPAAAAAPAAAQHAAPSSSSTAWRSTTREVCVRSAGRRCWRLLLQHPVCVRHTRARPR